MRHLSMALVVLAVAACQPSMPDSAAGVGFDDYDSYQREREARLRGGQTQDAAGSAAGAAPRTASGEPMSAIPGLNAAPGAASQEGSDSERIAQDAVAAVSGDGRPAPDPTDPELSDEQDFEAVAARETIESDRERLQNQRAERQVVEPQPLPERPDGDTPNIVAYALRTTNQVGEQLYERGGLFADSRFRRNCADYNNQDLAQEDFLRRGGPEDDPRGLDPDGDGFACWWEPGPYRNAARAQE